MVSNSIVRVICIKGELKLLSPLLIGSGKSEITNTDLSKYETGEVFIPASSLAGVLRNHLSYNNKVKPILDKVFGVGEKKSLLYFYDLDINKKGSMAIRYSNNLIETNLFNYEVLEKDNTFNFKLKLEIRKNNNINEEDYIKVLSNLLASLQSGEVSIGAKTKKGLGNIKLTNVQAVDFNFKTTENINEYINFNWDNNWKESKELLKLLNTEVKEVKYVEGKTIIETTLKIRDTINCRNYLTTDNTVNSEALAFNNKFIIPGTSIAGVFRSNILNHLKELNIEKSIIDIYMEDLFGSTNNASRIKFYELEDTRKESNFINITRNSIDRFTGGARKGNLFTSKIAQGGSVNFKVEISKSRNKDIDKNADIALVLISLFDLLSGVITIGSEGTVGRGFLVHNDNLEIDFNKIKINGNTLKNISDYIKEIEYLNCIQ